MSYAVKKTAQALAAIFPDSTPGSVQGKIEKVVSLSKHDGKSEAEIAELLETWRIQLPHRSAGWANADGALADLKRLLVSSSFRRPVLIPLFQKFADFAMKNWLPVASIVTIVVSGFYGLAYSRFYERLDVSPEQAGLSTAQIIAHSIVGGLALTFVVSLVIFLIFVPLVPSKEASATRPSVGTWANVGVNAAVTLAAILILSFIAWRTKVPILLTALVIGTVLFLAVIASLEIKRKSKNGRVALMPALLEFTPDSYVALAVAGLVFGIAITGIYTYTEANHLGTKASDGEAIHNPAILGVPFLGVEAEPTLIAWTGKQPTGFRIPSCALFLGSSGGEDLLYDQRTGTTITAPKKDIVLGLRGGRTSCEAPVNAVPPVIRRIDRTHVRCLPGIWDNDRKGSFSYRWTIEGEAIPIEIDGTSRVLNIEGTAPDEVAFCHVTATTSLGTDIAVSRGLGLGAPLLAEHARLKSGSHPAVSASRPARPRR